MLRKTESFYLLQTTDSWSLATGTEALWCDIGDVFDKRNMKFIASYIYEGYSFKSEIMLTKARRFLSVKRGLRYFDFG